MFTPARIAALSVVAVALIAYAVAQPSLTPPAGPIEQSGRFGARIELSQQTAPGNARAIFRITQPGSYYLTSDIDSGTRIAVMIASDNVTLDLNGYTISGRFGNGIQPERDITEDVVFENLVVRNGRITGYDTGISNDSFSGGFLSEIDRIVVEDLVITDVETGIRARNGRIARCVIEATGFGINASFCVIEGCNVNMVDVGQTGSVIGIDAVFCSTNGCFVNTNDAPTAGATVIGYSIVGGSINASTAIGRGVGFNGSNKGVATNCVSNNSAPDVFDPDYQTFNCNF
ncbi:MAG: hypothetical protein Tsb0013_08470 [Phycisphaerales bacterium]